MTILGIISKNRNEIQSILLDLKKKPIYTTVTVYELKMQAITISYVPRRYNYLTLFSTCHNVVKFSGNEGQKPNIVEDYNKTKVGVDTMNQIVTTYS